MQRIALTILWTIFLFPGVAEAQNLIVNGSFEQPPLTTSVFTGAIPGWTITGENGNAAIQRGVSGVSNSSGKQWIALDADAAITIYQDVPTVAGQLYRLVFFDGLPPGLTESRIDVLWNGVLQGWTTPTSSALRSIFADLAATGPVSRVGFRAVATAVRAGGLLDNITLIPIDAPGSLLGYNYYLPQLADGAGWLTTVLITSETGQGLSYTRTEYGSDGEVFLETNPVGLASNQTVALTTPGTGSSIRTGWIRIRTSAPANVAVIFREQLQGRLDFEASALARPATQRMAAVYDNRVGFRTGMAVANPNARAIRLNITLRNSTGVTVRTDVLDLAPRGHTAFFIGETWGETANILGRIEIEAVDSETGMDATFAPIGLRFSPGGAFTTLPY